MFNTFLRKFNTLQGYTDSPSEALYEAMALDVVTRVLMALSYGPLPQNEIACKAARKDSTSTSPRIMSDTLSYLEREGLVAFKNKKTWRRGQTKIYGLTPKGYKALDKALAKELTAVTDIFERFLELTSFILGNPSFRRQWTNYIQEKLPEDPDGIAGSVYNSLDKCVEKIHELKIDLGLISFFAPLRESARAKDRNWPMSDAKTLMETAVLIFDHSAKGQDEFDLPFRIIARAVFRAMLERASLEQKQKIRDGLQDAYQLGIP